MTVCENRILFNSYFGSSKKTISNIVEVDAIQSFNSLNIFLDYLNRSM